jgi:CubicO group peptidase (beta-lactamase class C family)
MKTLYHKIALMALVALSLASCLDDNPFKQEYTGFQPQPKDDGWEISTPEAQQMDRQAIEDACKLVYEDDRFVMARSLLVLRNGKLVAEVYPHEADDAEQIQNLQSITKSFTAIMAGVALQDGLLDSVGQTFESIYPEEFTEHPDKAAITLRDALTMRTGIDFDNGDHTIGLYSEKDNSVNFVLSRPKNHEPGIVYHYHDGAPQLVSYAIQKRVGKSLSAYADERLFKPLGITNWKWEAAGDDVTFGAFALYLKPRDAAKFGQLLLQNGEWKGEQLVDSEWIAEATSPIVTAGESWASYGYYFWVYPAEGAYSAVGHGGQHIHVVPQENLVVVYTAWPYTDGELFDNFQELADLLVHGCR